jgi:hypothetical protein
MNHTIIPAHEPKSSEPVRPQMVYVKTSFYYFKRQIEK